VVLAAAASDPNADTDSDGIADWYELHYSGSRTGLDAASDGDGDGPDAYAEWLALTDPTDSHSFFRVEAFEAVPGGTPVLRWHSSSGRVYGVVWRPDPMLPLENLATNLPATPPLNSFTDAALGAYDLGCYGVEVGSAP
jgi:hypothetical protein